MSIATDRYSADDLFALPKDGSRYELVKGELRTMPPSGGDHGRYAMRVSLPLGNHVVDASLGELMAAETGFRINRDPDTVRAPDVAYLAKERLPPLGMHRGFYDLAPDLAVEVLSANDSYSEVQEKMIDWLDAGVRMVILVDPRRRNVTIYRSRADIQILDESDTISGGDVVPGWTLPVAKIFA